MHEVSCARCETRVLAEKYSRRHTSIQWLDDASRTCALMRRGAVGAPGAGGARDVGQVCPALHATIDRAAYEGALPLSLRTEPVRGVLG